MRMPLSEDDQRRLDEIERSLTRYDPQVAARVSVQWRRRRLLSAITGFAVGVIIAVAGLWAMVAAAGVLLYGPLPR